MMQRPIAIFAAAQLSLVDAAGFVTSVRDGRRFKYTFHFGDPRNTVSEELTYSQLRRVAKEAYLPELRSGLGQFTAGRMALRLNSVGLGHDTDLTDVIQSWLDTLGHDDLQKLARFTGHPYAVFSKPGDTAPARKLERRRTISGRKTVPQPDIDHTDSDGEASAHADPTEQRPSRRSSSPVLASDPMTEQPQEIQQQLAPGTVQYMAPDGKPYYYNTNTKEASWDPITTPAPQTSNQDANDDTRESSTAEQKSDAEGAAINVVAGGETVDQLMAEQRRAEEVDAFLAWKANADQVANNEEERNNDINEANAINTEHRRVNLAGHADVKMQFLMMAGVEGFSAWLNEDRSMLPYLLNTGRLQKLLRHFGTMGFLKVVSEYPSTELFKFSVANDILPGPDSASYVARDDNVQDYIAFLKAAAGVGQFPDNRAVLRKGALREDFFPWAVRHGITGVVSYGFAHGTDLRGRDRGDILTRIVDGERMVFQEYITNVARKKLGFREGAPVEGVLSAYGEARAKREFLALPINHGELNELHVACEAGQGQVLKIILSQPTDQVSHLLDAKDDKQRTPLMLAAQYGTAEMVSDILDASGQDGMVDLNAQTTKGESSLMKAARRGDGEIVRHILHAEGKTGKADLNLQDGRGLSALMYAAKYGTDEMVRDILHAEGKTGKADLNLQKSDGWSALMYAAKFGTDEMVRDILHADGLDGMVDLNAQSSQGVSALMVAARYGTTQKVLAILRAKGKTGSADVHLKDTSGRKALACASRRSEGDKHREEIIRLLSGMYGRAVRL